MLLLSLLLTPIVVLSILINRDIGVSLRNIKFIALTTILNFFISLIIILFGIYPAPILDAIHYSVLTLIYLFDHHTVTCDAPKGWANFFPYDNVGYYHTCFALLIWVFLIHISIGLIYFYKDTLKSGFQINIPFFGAILSNILISLLKVKWNFLLFCVVLRLIKSPFYSVIELFIANIIFKYFLFLFVGYLITYLLSKYVWDKYFKNSYLFNLLDRSIAYDLVTIVLLIVLPLVVISSPSWSGYVFVISTTLREQYATMPNVSYEMFTTKFQEAHRRAYHKFPAHWTPLAEKKKLEVVANALSREGPENEKASALSQVLHEYISKDKNEAIAIFKDAHRSAIIKDNYEEEFIGVRHFEDTLTRQPGVSFFSSWF